MTLLPSSVTLSISLIEYFPPTKVQSNPGLGQPCTKHCEAVYSQNVCRLHLQALATSNNRCCLYSFKVPFLNQALYVSRPAISFGESWHRLESERLFSVLVIVISRIKDTAARSPFMELETKMNRPGNPGAQIECNGIVCAAAWASSGTGTPCTGCTLSLA